MLKCNKLLAAFLLVIILFIVFFSKTSRFENSLDKTLAELDNGSLSDKNTIHSYLDVYEELFSGVKNDVKNILEIGVREGGSVKLWSDYFPNCTVHGADISAPSVVKEYDRVVFHIQDAYTVDFVKKFDIKFDIIIDDGPHTLESMIFAVKNFMELLTDDGMLIIEDVQEIGWCDILKSNTPEEYHSMIKIYDRRDVKGRYDDIMFCIIKSKTQ
jgi:hypothetical protein